MNHTTILIAVIGCGLILWLRPVYGLAVYTVLSMWYPYCLGTVSVGTIDFSVGRIVIIALYAKVFFSTNLAGNFKVIWLDRLVIILFVAEILAGLTTTEPMRLIEYRSGDFFDMALPYFAVRLIITKKEHFITLLKAMVWSIAFLSLFGFYESITGHYLLALGRDLGPHGQRLLYLYRAQTTFRHANYFGIFSGMVAALCMGLVRIKDSKFVYKILAALAFLGCFSSMSSGGLLTLIGGLGFVAFYQYRYYWKQALIGLIMMCALVEIISNRNFYEVVGRFTFNSQTAWYRSRLFEVAIFEGGMSGHWLLGYGLAEPGWGLRIDTRDWTDVCNHYILQLCRYGLVGFIPFCAVIIASFKKLFEGFRLAKNDEDAWLIWCVAASLAGVLLGFLTVSLFGAPMIVVFIVFGLCVQVPAVVRRRSSSAWQDKLQAKRHRSQPSLTQGTVVVAGYTKSVKALG